MPEASAAIASDAAAKLRENRRGIGYICAAMACFVVNDSLVKYASESMPGSQLIFLRGVLATLLVLGLTAAAGTLSRARDLRDRRVIARAAIDAIGTFVYLNALFHLPIANATAITMAAPLFIAAFAALALGERVGVARWVAIGAGFAGVLLIIQPRAQGFNVWALACLAGTLLMAVRDLMTRRIPAGIPSTIVTLATAAAVTLVAGVASAAQGWQAVSGAQALVIAAASVFLAGGYYFVVVGMRLGELSVIGPFRYSAMLWALLIGWFVWRDVPNAPAWAGIALLAASGLYVLGTQRAR